MTGPALAQEGPLTTLLRPQPLSGSSPIGRNERLAAPNPLSGPGGRLFGDDPLASVDALTGAGSLTNPQRMVDPRTGEPLKPAAPGETAVDCQRPPRPGDPLPAPRLSYGGSGAGEYERYVNPGRPAAGTRPTVPINTATATGARPAGALPADRPLFGGTDRPLWGERAAPSSDAPAEAPAPSAKQAGVDQPLWAEGAAEPARQPPCPVPGRTTGPSPYSSPPRR